MLFNHPRHYSIYQLYTLLDLLCSNQILLEEMNVLTVMHKDLTSDYLPRAQAQGQICRL